MVSKKSHNRLSVILLCIVIRQSNNLVDKELGATEVIRMSEPKWRESISIELEREDISFEVKIYQIDDLNGWSNVLFSVLITQNEI